MGDPKTQEVCASGAVQPTTTVPAPDNRCKAPCTTCLELIFTGAKKCTKCESYQDWRKHVTVSTALLAIIVSALAAGVAAYPIAHQAIRKLDSDLRVSPNPILESGHIFVVISNFGKGVGSVDLVKATMKIPDQRKVIWFHLVRPIQASDSGMIPGDGNKQLDFEAEFPATYLTDDAWDPVPLSASQLSQQEKELATGKCQLSIEIVSFRGVKSDQPLEVDCYNFQALIRHYWNAVPHGQQIR